MELEQWVDFQQHGDSRGQLVALEIGKEKNIPFDIQRVYYIYNTGGGVSRGYHAHRNLNQVVICLSGSCVMVLDDGFDRKEILMQDPTRGLLIESFVWREMHHFSENCVLLVLASEHYDSNDYIRDYSYFKKEVMQRGL